MYFILLLFLALLIAGIIALLHRYQVKNHTDIVNRTAPLAAVDLSFLEQMNSPDFSASAAVTPEPVPEVPVFTSGSTSEAGNTDNWQEQVKRLREENQDQAALALCRQQFPRIQAFQYAVVILRHLLRVRLDANHGVAQELKELYRLAVMADLYRNSNPIKPKDARRTLQHLLQHEFDYNAIGSRHLRLLTKSDIRHLEQLWGMPQQHRHAEDYPGIDWKGLCQ
jgi:hypothetical protein